MPFSLQSHLKRTTTTFPSSHAICQSRDITRQSCDLTRQSPDANFKAVDEEPRSILKESFDVPVDWDLAFGRANTFALSKSMNRKRMAVKDGKERCLTQQPGSNVSDSISKNRLKTGKRSENKTTSLKPPTGPAQSVEKCPVPLAEAKKAAAHPKSRKNSKVPRCPSNVPQITEEGVKLPLLSCGAETGHEGRKECGIVDLEGVGRTHDGRKVVTQDLESVKLKYINGGKTYRVKDRSDNVQPERFLPDIQYSEVQILLSL